MNRTCRPGVGGGRLFSVSERHVCHCLAHRGRLGQDRRIDVGLLCWTRQIEHGFTLHYLYADGTRFSDRHAVGVAALPHEFQGKCIGRIDPGRENVRRQIDIPRVRSVPDDKLPCSASVESCVQSPPAAGLLEADLHRADGAGLNREYARIAQSVDTYPVIQLVSVFDCYLGASVGEFQGQRDVVRVRLVSFRYSTLDHGEQSPSVSQNGSRGSIRVTVQIRVSLVVPGSFGR